MGPIIHLMKSGCQSKTNSQAGKTWIPGYRLVDRLTGSYYLGNNSEQVYLAWKDQHGKVGQLANLTDGWPASNHPPA